MVAELSIFNIILYKNFIQKFPTIVLTRIVKTVLTTPINQFSFK